MYNSGFHVNSLSLNMFFQKVLFIAGITFVFSSFILYPQADDLCGPYSLLYVMKYYKVDLTIEEVCKLTKYKENVGTTMLSLYNAAKMKGLPVVALK